MRRGELLEEFTSEDRKRTESVLAVCVLHVDDVEVGAFVGASANEAHHFRDAMYALAGWIPMPLLALRMLWGSVLLPMSCRQRAGVSWLRLKA